MPVHPQIRKRWRLAASCVGWIFIGAIVTIVLAEASALWSPLTARSDDYFYKKKAEGWRLTPRESYQMYAPADGRADSRRTRLELVLDPAWLAWYSALDDPMLSKHLQTYHGPGVLFEHLGLGTWFDGPSAGVTSMTVGWPFRCGRASRTSTSSGWSPPKPSKPWSGAIEPPALLHPRQTWTGPGLFVTSPLWPGLLGDTVFWGLLPFALCRAIVHLRRRLRGRRGECLNCAYPVPGLGRCPECGLPVSARVEDKAVAVAE